MNLDIQNIKQRFEIIGTDPKYPKLKAKPEVFPIFFSFEQLLSKEL